MVSVDRITSFTTEDTEEHRENSQIRDFRSAYVTFERLVHTIMEFSSSVFLCVLCGKR